MSGKCGQITKAPNQEILCPGGRKGNGGCGGNGDGERRHPIGGAPCMLDL